MLLQLVNSRTRTGKNLKGEHFWRRELDNGNLTTGTDDRNWQVSDLPGQKSNWNWRIGQCFCLLKYPGGWSFYPILRFSFSRTRPLWYFLISINFISCQFSSFFSKQTCCQSVYMIRFIELASLCIRIPISVYYQFCCLILLVPKFNFLLRPFL